MLSVLTMCSQCAHWVYGPLSPVAADVDDVAIGTSARHEERVDMGFPKEGRDRGNDGGNEEVLRLANLALVTSFDKPANILVEIRPPEAKEEVAARSEDTLVAEVVVSVLDQLGALSWLRNELCATVLTFPEEAGTADVVVLRLTN